jgi:hypothetical protein
MIPGIDHRKILIHEGIMASLETKPKAWHTSCDERQKVKGMAELKDDIAAYDAMKADLEAKSLGKWVVFRERKLIGTYESFDAAAQDAVHRFGRGPYLIRQVGAPPISMPASVMYHPVYADDDLRVQ